MTQNDLNISATAQSQSSSSQDLSLLVQQGIIKGHELRSLAFMNLIGWKFPTSFLSGMKLSGQKRGLNGTPC
ncbi:hypothetical protein [Sneathiella glossodoripedis]|uniref:hypothetical protein n=1 Tax=Sneathiella glossodoripedis TaxID=418853 RepID=UPI000471C5CA|nr:hypothetical protein [Sneathiella glossodoripedis]